MFMFLRMVSQLALYRNPSAEMAITLKCPSWALM